MSLLLVALAVPQVMAETVTISKGDVSNKSEVPFWTSYGDYGYHGQMIYSQDDLADLPSGATITAITFSANSNIVATGGSVNTPFVIKMGEPANATYASASFVTENLTTVSTTADIWSGTTNVTINFTTPYTYNGGNLLVDLLCAFNSQGQYNTSPIYWKTYASTNSSCYARGNSSGVLQKPNQASYLPVITITYEVSTEPTIKVEPETVTINTDPYTAGAASFTVTGTNLTNDINLSVSGSGFAVNPQTITAANAANGVPVTVTYSAQEAGTFNGTITLTSEGADSKTVNVTANVVQPVISGTVTPTSLNFETYAGATATNTISIENTGNRAFTPTFTIAAPFSIEAATEIAAGASKDFTVTYAPTAVGSNNGTLAVDINGTTTNVTLNGTANEAPKEATVADGTERNYKLPVYGYYYDNANNNYNQMIYPASMIPSYLTGKKITSLTFYSSGIKFSGGNLAIRLATTDAEKFTSTAKLDMPSNAVSQNFVHHANEALDPITVTFDEPFEYNGGNIIIETQVTDAGTCDPYNSSTYQPDYTYFYGVNTTENYSYCGKGSYGSAELLKFLPKVTFAYEDSETPATPVITVDPATVDAFSTEVGTPVTATVNVSGENLTGDITAAISGENADCFTAALENGVLTITYNPTAAGNHTATLTLSSEGAKNVTIDLTGTATAPTVPTITVNPATLNINAALGETKTASFTVTGANLEGDITVAASEGFTVSPTTITAADAAAGATVTVTYVAPATADTKTGTVTLTSEGAEAKTVAINATAAEITYDFTVEPESLDFGEVYVGQSNILAVTIKNNGNDNINPVFTFNNNVFTVEDDSYPVYGGTSQTYNIVYTPVAAGTDNGTVQITIGSQTVTVSLTGKGKELAAYDIASSAASGVHNFGDAFVDGTASWSFTITNNGKNAVTPTIEGLAEPFSTTYESAAIASGESATITINFKPTAIQAYGPTSIVVKFNETADFQFDYTLRGNGIENTGTLPPSTYANYSYTWTDDNGDEHTSAYNEIATDPNQMIALLKAIYTDKNMPGNYYRGYKADGTVDTDHPVAYPAIGQITVDKYYKTEFLDAYGWGMNHDETTYPTQEKVVSTTANEHKFYYMNPNEYKPNQEGLTLLLVEMNDGVGASTIETKPTDYASLKNLYKKMFKSVRVIPNSKRVTKDGVDGTLFKIDCDKMNRFFFLAKGRLRLYDETEYSGGLNMSSHARATKKLSGSSSGQVSVTSVDNEHTTSTVNPFNAMYEQFSPVSLSSSEASSDVYQLLINMESYDVEHDCEAIPWASSESVSGHEFNMYGKTSISDDCQDVRDLMFFVPDQRMMYYSGRDKGNSDMFVNYYKQYAPNMGMYVIRQNPITGEKIEGEDTYKLHLTWDSNLTDFVPAENGVYYIYQVNEDGSYTKVGETNAQTKELDVNVAMLQHGQQVTYVIQGQDNTRFLSLQYSNEESFIIPGLDPNEKFQMMAGAEYYSRFDPQTVHNFYANGMQIKGYPDATVADYAGKTMNFYRKAAGDNEEWTLVGTAAVSSDGTSATVSMVDATQRKASEYKFGYMQNPESVSITTDENGYKVFGVIYDNFKADVSANDHAASYSYKMEVNGEQLHSNEMSIKVFKTTMSNITGSFDLSYVENDDVRQAADKGTEFEIDVEHSSKTEILRYGTYRWDSSFGTETNPYAVLNLNSSADAEEDISPAGQASNQGEYYSVYMNGDSYIGDDVYVAQGETGKATFVDNVPETAVDEYTYAPVIETFTGRSDYNTYGAPMQVTATGELGITIGDMTQSEDITWTADGKTYTYYKVLLNVDKLSLPKGYEVAKVRAWRHIDASYLGEQKDKGYEDRAKLDANGDYMFVKHDDCQQGESLGDTELVAEGGQYGQICEGTFGALKLEDGESIPMKFTVRVYFTKSEQAAPAGAPSLKAETGDSKKYYITEFELNDELTSSIPTSIFGVVAVKEVAGIKYYNMMGVESNVPFQGANIEVTTYTDGSRSSRKIMK